MNNCRIVERQHVDGMITYVIQQRHFLFRWWWVDAWMNNDVSTKDEFNTAEEARKHLCYFDKSKCIDTVIPNQNDI